MTSVERERMIAAVTYSQLSPVAMTFPQAKKQKTTQDRTQITIARCIGCGADLTGRHGKTRFCTSSCRGRFIYKERTNHTREGKTCLCCGADISTKDGHAKYCSDKCKTVWRAKITDRTEYAKAYRDANLNDVRRKTRERMATLRSTAEGREKSCKATKEWKDRNREKVRRSDELYRRRKGAMKKWGLHNAHVRDYKKLLNQPHDAHVRDFYVWKRNATRGELARLAKAMGKPWKNSKLSDAIQYKIKYRMNLEFRLGEINRQTWRKETLQDRDDGTINFFALLRERKTCPYCGIKITKANAVADHMDPLSKGGNNTTSNLTICCDDCNKKKSAKTYLDWMICLPETRRSAAMAWYKKKKGHQPEQQTLTFSFEKGTPKKNFSPR